MRPRLSGCQTTAAQATSSVCSSIYCHVQERIAEREAAQPGGSWRKSYYMPTESDRCTPCTVFSHNNMLPTPHMTACEQNIARPGTARQPCLL